MLPCPFCGDTQATIFEHFKDAHYFYANCIGCDAEGPPALSSKEARDAWNHRGRSSDETTGEPWKVGDTWHCQCGAANVAERCSNCGRARAAEWGEGRSEKAEGN